MMNGNDREPAANVWAGGLILAVLAAICTALVAFTYRITAPRIAANEQAYLEQSLAPLLEGIPYTNSLSESTLVIPPPHELPGKGPAIVYRVYADDKPVAALFVVTAEDGFSGPIKLLIGIDTSMSITSVRILEHRETPGLGDLIESSKSDWLTQLDNTSLEAPPRDSWSIKRDGGVFDQLTGASITPRAIIKAVKRTLLYFEENRDSVFETEPPSQNGPSA
ncbi:MAG: electron transport complex subunit RsxG [Gammaproteobacteria bacterium]|nr:electron transport complex subunit RsxG [Gammaproteobacteria bacterium]